MHELTATVSCTANDEKIAFGFVPHSSAVKKIVPNGDSRDLSSITGDQQ